MAGKTPSDSDRHRQDCLLNCGGVAGSNPVKAGKIKHLRFGHNALQYAVPASSNIAVVVPGRTKSVQCKSFQPFEHKKQKKHGTESDAIDLAIFQSLN